MSGMLLLEKLPSKVSMTWFFNSGIKISDLLALTQLPFLLRPKITMMPPPPDEALGFKTNEDGNFVQRKACSSDRERKVAKRRGVDSPAFCSAFLVFNLLLASRVAS